MTKPVNREVSPGTISVLYVDDEPSNQLAMRAILSSQKQVTVTEALDEEDAMDVLEEHDALPDIVFMDQGLGHITGVEACTVSRGSTRMQVIKLITDKYGDAIKFVICTGLSNQEAEDLSEETRAAGFLCKPYDAKAVLEMLHKLLP